MSKLGDLTLTQTTHTPLTSTALAFTGVGHVAASVQCRAKHGILHHYWLPCLALFFFKFTGVFIYQQLSNSFRMTHRFTNKVTLLPVTADKFLPGLPGHK